MNIVLGVVGILILFGLFMYAPVVGFLVIGAVFYDQWMKG